MILQGQFIIEGKVGLSLIGEYIKNIEREGDCLEKGTYKQVTRKDVAEAAGVSVTVVSYVINNNRYVDKEKRKRVEEAIQKLHYKPNSIARALKGKKLNHIVFIADQIVTEHFSFLVSELDKNAYDLGYMISLCANRNTQQFVNSIISRQYDGVIISSISFNKEYIRQLIAADIPVVLIANRNYDDVEGAAKIYNGLYEGARENVRYLKEKGCRNIVYIDRFSKRKHYSDMNDMRYRGYVEEMIESGLSEHPEKQFITGCEDEDEVRQKVQTYLKEHKVDAIFGRNDKLACIAMQTARKMGYRIPEDIAVIGFDNSSLGQYCEPPITSMEIQREKVAKTAIDMLQQMIDTHTLPDPVRYQTKLIERESTAKNIK